MGIPQLRVARSVLPTCRLNIAARSALTWLADTADEHASLAWVSHAKMAGLIGCAPDYVGKLIAALEIDGMVSTWRRAGRVPVYLVHPAGLDRWRPASGTLTLACLHRGRFSADDRAAIMGWLRSLNTPDTSSGVNRAPADPPKSDRPTPDTSSAPTPDTSSPDPSLIPDQSLMAAPRPGLPVGPAVAPAVRGWATPEALDAIKAEAALMAEQDRIASDRAA